MSQTNTDYLFQVIAPTTDRNAGSARSDGDGPEFGQHLSQASVSVFDAVQPPSRNDTSSVNSTSDYNSTTSLYARFSSGSSTKPTDYGRGDRDTDRSSAPTKPSTPDNSPATTSDAPAAAKNDDDKPRDADKPDDDDAPSIANATVSDGKNAPPKTEPGAHKADGDSATPVKGNVSPEDAARLAAKRTAETDGEPSKPDAQAKEANAKLANAAEVEKAAKEAPTETGTANADTSGADKTGKSTKKDEPVVAAHEAAKADTATPNKQATKEATAESNAAQTAESTEKATAETQSNGNPAPAKSQKATDSKASADDDDLPGGKSNGRANSPSIAAATASKSDAIAVANIVSAVLEAAQADPTSDADHAATKRVAAKADVAALSLGSTTRANADTSRTGRAVNASETPVVDPARFVSRVAKAIQTANDRGGKLQLRLSPSELGSVHLELTVKDGVMSASLQTETANARHALLEHLPELRDRLAQQNIRIDRFDVDVQQENSGGQPNSQGPHQQPGQQQQPENPGTRRAVGIQQGEAATSDTPVTVPAISSTGINLII